MYLMLLLVVNHCCCGCEIPSQHSPYQKPKVCSKKNTIDWVAYKHLTFISHSSGGWEIQDQASDLGVWGGPILRRWRPLVVTSTGGRRARARIDVL
jgi:hypothetical protein